MDQPQPLPPKPPQKDSKNKPAGTGLPPQWRNIIWYIPLALLLLWFWQEMLTSMRVKTIPYSEFKEYLANDEVTEVEVKQDEIEGKILPKARPTVAPGQERTAETSAPQKAQSSAQQLKQPAPAENKQPAKQPEAPPPTSKKDTSATAEKPAPAASDQAAQNAAPEGPFLFRTIRVEDTKLVDELVAHHVKFVGTRPNMLTTFLFAWILPLLFFGGIWYFLSRRMGSMGQTVMSIGKSKARLIADKDTGVSFGDVAGCDEAKYEL